MRIPRHSGHSSAQDEAEKAKRLLFIEDLIIYGTPLDRIVQLAMRPSGPINKDPLSPGFGRLLSDGKPPGLGITRNQVNVYVKLVKENLTSDSDSNRSRNRADTERRLLNDIRDARNQRRWGAVAAFERLLSDVQGTKAPVRVDLTLNVNAALANVLNSLSPDEMNGLVSEYEELELKAKGNAPVLLQRPKVTKVTGSRGKEYEVTEKDGIAKCSCPDFSFRGHERPCKHILALLPQTGLR